MGATKENFLWMDGLPVPVDYGRGSQRHFDGPQDLNMVNEMTVADNLFINRQPGRAGLVNQAVMMRRAQEIIDDFGLHINPNSLVKEIGIAQKQLIVIAVRCTIRSKH